MKERTYSPLKVANSFLWELAILRREAKMKMAELLPLKLNSFPIISYLAK